MHPIELLHQLESLKGELATATHPALHAKLCAQIDAARQQLLLALADLPAIPEQDECSADPKLLDEHKAFYDGARSASLPDGQKNPLLDALSQRSRSIAWKTFGQSAAKSKTPRLDGAGLPIQFEDWAHDHLELPAPAGKKTPARTSDSWFHSSASIANANIGIDSSATLPPAGASSAPADWETWLTASASLSNSMSGLDPAQRAVHAQRLIALAAALTQDPQSISQHLPHDSTAAAPPPAPPKSIQRNDARDPKSADNWATWFDKSQGT